MAHCINLVKLTQDAFFELMEIHQIVPKITTTIFDKKESNGKEVNKPVEIIIPRPYYNELDRDRIGRRSLSKKSYSKSAVVDSYNSSNGKIRSLGRNYIR